MKQNDPTLAALLVKHIGDVEAAIAYVTASIDPLLWQTAAEILEKKAGEQGYKGVFDPHAPDLWFMPPGWAASASASASDLSGDAWFHLSCSEAGPNESMTSLARFLGSGAPGDTVSLAFGQGLLKGRKWAGVLAGQEAALQTIRDAGFNIEQRQGRIEMPVTLDPDELAAALRDEDPGAAFGPLHRALAASVAVLPEFGKLVAAARESRASLSPEASVPVPRGNEEAPA